MTGSALGGGLIFLVAALLWAAVLVPAWVRRREFRSAEKNALRLQRTLRILAETSEVPQEVMREATAKEALAQEKLLKAAQRRQEAEREAELAEERAAQVRAEIRSQRQARVARADRRRERLRGRGVRIVRGSAAIIGLLGFLGVFVGIGLVMVQASVLPLIWSAGALLAGLATLVLLAPGRARVKAIPAERVETEKVSVVPSPEVREEERVLTGETIDAAAAHRAAQRAAAEQSERARVLARAREQARTQAKRQGRAEAQSQAAAQPAPQAQAASQPAPQAQAASQPAAQTRTSASRPDASAAAASAIRQMGVVGDTSDGSLDLDSVLRRRRAS